MNSPNESFRPPARGALHDHLAGLAEEVTPVNLHDRILSSSHRAAVRRRVLLASSAAFAVVAIASGVAWAGLPASRDDRVVPSASSAAPAPSNPASPRPSAPVPSRSPETASSRPSNSPSSRPPDSLPAVGATLAERLFYQSVDGDLRWLLDGTVVDSPAAGSGTCGLVVSPNRARIAYVTSDGGGATGDLVVSAPDGTAKRTVLTGVSCMGGSSPVWLPDSRRLLLQQGNRAPRVVVDVRTGKTGDTPLKNVIGYVAWSPSGSYVAYQDAGRIVVARPDGTVVRRVAHGDETPTGGFSVQGVSDDGRRAVVGMTNTDPDIIRTGFLLVDTVTGRNVDLPSSIAPADPRRAAILTAPGNHLVVRMRAGSGHELFLVGPNGKVLDNRSEPSTLSTSTLLTAF